MPQLHSNYRQVVFILLVSSIFVAFGIYLTFDHFFSNNLQRPSDNEVSGQDDTRNSVSSTPIVNSRLFPTSHASFSKISHSDCPENLTLLIELFKSKLLPNSKTTGTPFAGDMIINSLTEEFGKDKFPFDLDSNASKIMLSGHYDRALSNSTKNYFNAFLFWIEIDARSVYMNIDRTLAAVVLDRWQGTDIPERVILRAKQSTTGGWGVYDVYFADSGVHLSHMVGYQLMQEPYRSEWDKPNSLIESLIKVTKTPSSTIVNSVAASTSDNQIRSHFLMRIAMSRYLGGRFSDAFEISKAVADGPAQGNEIIPQLVARIAIEAGQLVEAEKFNEIYKSRSFDDAYYYGTKGKIYKLRGDTSKARDAYLVGLSRDPRSVECFINVVKLDGEFVSDKYAELFKGLGSRKMAILDFSTRLQDDDTNLSSRLFEIYSKFKD